MRLARVFWKIPRYTTSTDQEWASVVGAPAELPSAVLCTIRTVRSLLNGPTNSGEWYETPTGGCQGGGPLGLLPCATDLVYEHVLSAVDGPVGVVTLNRPKQLNALAGPVMAE